MVSVAQELRVRQGRRYAQPANDGRRIEAFESKLPSPPSAAGLQFSGRPRRRGAIRRSGAGLVLVGVALRAAAQYTAKGSFRHLVQTTKASDHRLVTEGVYGCEAGADANAVAVCPTALTARFERRGAGMQGGAVCRWSRHPAYAGFFWYSVGTQVLLANPVALLGYIAALYKFFVERIAYPPCLRPIWGAARGTRGVRDEGSNPATERASYTLTLCVSGWALGRRTSRRSITEEEDFLVQFFGNAYEQYRSRVPTLIPFVR